MDIRQIEYFRALCEVKNYTRAAEQLHISQPSLSVAIRRLEEELQVTLLKRDNKRVMLTQAGAVLLRESAVLLKQMAHIRELMDDLRDTEARTLKIAVPATVGAWLWPVLMEDFRRKYPEIRLCIEDSSTYEILAGITNDELEIGYGVIDLNENPDIACKILVQDELKLLLAADDVLARDKKVDLAALAGRTVLMYRKGASFSEKLLLQELVKQQINVQLLYVKEQATVFNLVAQGLGVAVVLDETELIKNNSRLCTKEFVEPLTYQSGFFWKKDRYLSSSAKKLLSFFA